jgi:integral membrane sensor domain MASE1
MANEPHPSFTAGERGKLNGYLRPRAFAAMLGTAAIYFCAAKLGLSMAVIAEQVSAVWPSTGISLAAILLFGRPLWPGIWLGAFAANFTANEPIATAFGIASGNTLEAVIGAWLLTRWVRFDTSLERLKDVLGLIVFGAGFSTTISATVGVASLCLGGVHPWSNFASL